MSDRIWYLGPLGDLRPLTCPEPGINMTEERYGGVFQALSGARTMDVSGHRARYEFEYTYLDKDEYRWLHALHSRLVPGPFVLLDPLKKNRVSLQSSRLRARAPRTSGVSAPNTQFRYSRDFPEEIDLPGLSLETFDWVIEGDVGDAGFVRVDYNKPAACRPNEELTFSFYAKSSSADETIGVYLDYFDIDQVQQGNSYFEFPTTADWQRIVLTEQMPAGAAAARLVFVGSNIQTDGVWHRYAAPQIEAGPEATDWEQGGGAPYVLLDQLETTSPRFPLRDCSLTLLEA